MTRSFDVGEKVEVCFGPRWFRGVITEAHETDDGHGNTCPWYWIKFRDGTSTTCFGNNSIRPMEKTNG